jgi:hypothetical protein
VVGDGPGQMSVVESSEFLEPEPTEPVFVVGERVLADDVGVGLKQDLFGSRTGEVGAVGVPPVGKELADPVDKDPREK